MLQVPRRRALSREDFVAAVAQSYEQLYALYQDTRISMLAPEWTNHGHGETVFHASLPIDMAWNGGDAHALASILKQMIERGKSIKRLARVETPRTWYIWIETD